MASLSESGGSRSELISEEYVNPLSLNLVKRFDIFIKYLYVKYYESCSGGDWYHSIYTDHIKVLNGFYEGDGSGKLGKEMFVSSFNQTIESIKEAGYLESSSAIPCGTSLIPVDGAHRIASCLFFDKLVKVIPSDKVEYVYDYNFFRDRGFNDSYSDAVAIEFCKLFKNSFVALVFPSARGLDEEVEHILSESGEIFYRKDIEIPEDSAYLLMKELYHGEPWLGDWSNDFKGAKSKARECFKEDGCVRVFVLKSSLSAVLQVKNRIRNLFGIGNHSIHITDSQDQSVDISNILFNKNSLLFLILARPRYFNQFDRYLKKYKEMVFKDTIDKEQYCIDGSSVLSLFGLREVRDLDYLHIGSKLPGNTSSKISSHNDEATYYSVPIEELIANPNHYFYSGGVKFVSLEDTCAMKKNRSEPKDINDLIKLDGILKKASKLKPKVYVSTKNRLFINAELLRVKARFYFLYFTGFCRRITGRWL